MGDVAHDLLRVAVECGAAGRLVEGGFGIEKSAEGDFRVDGEGACTGQTDEHVGAQAIVRFLLEKIAIGDHAGELGHAAEGELAPTAAGIGSAQSLR